MKKATNYILFAYLLAPMSFATYYEITTDSYTPGFDLQTGNSLYMTDGGFGNLVLQGDSSALIEGTSNLMEGSGGIWHLNSFNESHLNISGGQVHMIDISSNATAYLSGGLIEQIRSGQHVAATSGPHITIECLDPYYNADTKMLIGHWLKDGTAFSIYLIDVTNYSPAIENIQFVPEPATLALLSLGGLLLRRKRS